MFIWSNLLIIFSLVDVMVSGRYVLKTYTTIWSLFSLHCNCNSGRMYLIILSWVNKLVTGLLWCLTHSQHSKMLLVSLAKGLSILLISSKNQLLVALICSIVFCVFCLFSFYFIYFCSNLYYFLPSTWFGVLFVVLPPLGVRLVCLFEIFLISQRRPVLLYTSLI